MRHKANPSLAVLALALAVTLMGGCGSADDSGGGSAGAAAAGGDASASAWEAEMDAIAASTESEAVKQILADHVITEAEVSSVQDAMRTCLAPAGVTEITFSDTEIGYETNTPDGAGEDLTEVMTDCESSTGYSEITYLYQSIHSNPEHNDPTQAIVDCLIRNQVVESTYTVADYNRDAASDSLPGSDTEAGLETLIECQQEQS